MRKLLVFLFAAAFVVAFVAPSFAAISENFSIDYRFRMQTYYDDYSEELAGPSKDGGDSDFVVKPESHRVRIRYRSDEVEAMFDIRSTGGEGAFDEMWAQLPMGPGNLRMGRQWSLTFNPFTSLGSPGAWKDTGYGGYGQVNGFRYLMPLGKMTLSLGAYENNGTPTQTVPGSGPAASGDLDVMLPALEAKLDFVVGPTANNVFVGYRTCEYDAVPPASDITVDSYVIGGYGALNLGAFTVHYTLWMDSNAYGGRDYKIPSTFGYSASPIINAAGDDVEDMSALGWTVSAGYKINQMLAINGGVGNVMVETDLPGGGTAKMSPFTYCANLPIYVNKYLTVIPYFWTLDYGDAEVTGLPDSPLGDQTRFGAYWQILF